MCWSRSLCLLGTSPESVVDGRANFLILTSDGSSTISGVHFKASCPPKNQSALSVDQVLGRAEARLASAVARVDREPSVCQCVTKTLPGLCNHRPHRTSGDALQKRADGLGGKAR
jgi:hypothetical protein